MRVNIRKVTLVVGIILFLWLLLSYSSMLEVPKSLSRKPNVIELENKIDQLQRKMDAQLSDSKLLLQKIKKELHPLEDAGNLQHVEVQKTVDTVQFDGNLVLPVLVIACNRVTVKRCLDNLLRYRPNKDMFPILVSQDCGHEPTYQVIKSFTDNDPSITVVQQPDLAEIPLPRAKIKFRGYYKIARHYKFALNHVFVTLGHDAVLIVEDDLDISPDFFEYFLGTYPLLLKDPSLWCISAWNDNGKKDVIEQSRADMLHRTDFFPGLGWLLRRDMWLKLAPKWPTAFFDDWLRNPDNIEGKSCIRPEISRTYSFGKEGVSKGLFFDMHLKKIILNRDFVEFTKLNLTYLLKDYYDPYLETLISELPEVTADNVMFDDVKYRNVRVMYSNAKTYQRAAKKLGLMDDFRSGVPRTAYRGIVSCFVRGVRVYLAPDFQWTKYDPKWG